jgi:hypothetical protein
MAQQTIGIGTTANDGTGDPLRSAFDKSNDNFTELYGKPDLSLATNTLTLTKADGTTDTVDLAPYLDDTAITSASIDGAGVVTFTNSDTSTFTLDLSSLLDDTNLITTVDAGTGLEVDTTTGDVTVSISDNGVGHDQLSNRYTASSAVTSATSITLDTSTADVFTWTAGHSTTVDFTNVKVGSTCAVVITGGGGSYTLALGNINGASGTFNTLGGTYSDTSSAKNLIEFKFISTSEAWYQISQIAS